MSLTQMYEVDFSEDWTLLAELDESAGYEVDITRIYSGNGKIVLATASGCSCWGGEFDVEYFDTLDALEASVSVTGDDRRYQPSPRAAAELIPQARAALHGIDQLRRTL